MQSFELMGLPDNLLQTLQYMQFKQPTPIQAQTIPIALQGRDILGSAQTGTGKTAAFGIPLVSNLILNENNLALVLTPTRELATQVMSQLCALLGRGSRINHALLIGGESIVKQLKQLRANPRLIVGTPGRVLDHLQRRSLILKKANFLVLDEMDRMLDMGFNEQIGSIVNYIENKQRQTLLFSATIPANIMRMAQSYLNNPEKIIVESKSVSADNITQEMLRVSDAEKYPCLLDQLATRTGSIVVFVKTKYSADKIAMQLAKDGHLAHAIHGDLRQHKRERVLMSFRKQRYRILVATDVAARGLDIPHIEHVINYDLPQCPEDYVHRIGRTARAGAKGFALNLVSNADNRYWHAITRLLNKDEEKDIPRRNKPGHKKSGDSYADKGSRGNRAPRYAGDSYADKGSRGSKAPRHAGESYADKGSRGSRAPRHTDESRHGESKHSTKANSKFANSEYKPAKQTVQAKVTKVKRKKPGFSQPRAYA